MRERVYVLAVVSMSNEMQSILPYGQCPVSASEGTCVFKTYPHEIKGEDHRALTCPDHARLHAIVDHGFGVTQCNKQRFAVDRDVRIGLKATHYLNPADKSPAELQDTLRKIPEDMQPRIEICAGEALGIELYFQ